MKNNPTVYTYSTHSNMGVTWNAPIESGDSDGHPYGGKPHVHKPTIESGWDGNGPWHVTYGDVVVIMPRTRWERIIHRFWHKDWEPGPEPDRIQKALKVAVRLHDQQTKRQWQDITDAEKGLENAIGIFRVYDEGPSEKWGSELMEEYK